MDATVNPVGIYYCQIQNELMYEIVKCLTLTMFSIVIKICSQEVSKSLHFVAIYILHGAPTIFELSVA